MYPTLTDLLKDLFGINVPLPIQTYGLWMAISFFAGGFILILEFRRKENEGRLKVINRKITIGERAKPEGLAISALIGFVLGFKLVEAIFHYSDFVSNPQNFLMSLRGNFIGGFIVAAISAYMHYRDKEKQKLDKPQIKDITVHPYELTGNILILGAVFGILGSKIFHNLENIDDLIADPIGSIFSFSGLSYLGGFLLAGAAIIYYANKNKIKPLDICDIVAPGLAVAYGVGRIGCHMAGDGCWGIVNTSPKPGWMSFLPDWLWKYNFPHNVINQGPIFDNCTGKFCHYLDKPVYPTSLYEFILMMVIFAIIWMIRKHVKLSGMLFCIYLILSSVERFGMEQIRINNKYHFLGISATQAEIISIVLIIAGIVGIFLIQKYRSKIENN